jgi:hypothetical protein
LLEFKALRERKQTLPQLTEGLTRRELRDLTEEMVHTQLALLADCVDADVVFEPDDPEAFDSAAATAEEVHMPWTLGHVIVHITASAEEAAAVAAELARGVPYHGRSRYEVPWMQVTTIEQCRRRLEESRRMRLASLDMWPDEPHLDNTYRTKERSRPLNATDRFVLGLLHEYDHLGQLEDIIRQARQARGVPAGEKDK